jgi:hypothetical protein
VKYEVIKECHPEEYTSVLTVKVRNWHSFISGGEEVKEFLAVSGKKTKDGNLEIYEAPSFALVSDDEEDEIWKAVKRYRDTQKLSELEEEMKAKYGEYFEEPINGPSTYRANPNK